MKLESLLVVAALTLTPTASEGQAPSSAPRRSPRHALSLSPVGLFGSGYIAAEYEVRLATRLTAGLGAGTMMGQSASSGTNGETESDRLTHGDLFARWHLTGSAFSGTSVGVRSGLSRLPGERTYPGLGLDVHRSWILGRRVVSNVGWGMKRVFGGTGTAFDQRYVPWLKAHIGIAF